MGYQGRSDINFFYSRIAGWLMLGMVAGIAMPVASATRSDPYKVITTTGMVTDIVKAVAGDKAQVVGLMGEGIDPHLYKPNAADVRKVLVSDCIFFNGLMLEGRMADTFFKAARLGKSVYPVTESIDQEFLLEPPEFSGHWDPHVWMDVVAWSKCVEAVREALTEEDPDNGEYYRANCQAYLKKLTGLHQYVKNVIASIPQAQRVLITAHDAFNYFARAYGIEVRGVQGISTESEAGISDINHIIDFIIDRNIQAVFIETSVSDKNVRALIEGAKNRGHHVVIGGKLFSDAMGPSGTYEGTYFGMIDHNATTIARALGGHAKPGGMKGKLKSDDH